MQGVATTLSSLQGALSGSSAELLGKLAELIEEPKDPAAQQEAWSQLELSTLRHLRAQEELLLPHFELAAPADASQIRQHHEAIRERLHRISAKLEAGQWERDELLGLLSLLRVSTRNEERKLYDWAEHCLRPSRKTELIARLRKVPAQVGRKSRAG